MAFISPVYRHFLNKNKYLFSSVSFDFHKVADSTLNRIFDRLDTFTCGVNGKTMETELSMGVLTICIKNTSNDSNLSSTIVINKQPPNMQLWWSSPLSGPKRYKFCLNNGQWLNVRDESDVLEKCLISELMHFLNKKLPENIFS